jgi:hypothetical protein
MATHHGNGRVLGVAFAALLVTACDRRAAAPTVPSVPLVPTSIVITSANPASGSTLTPSGTPPGTFFTRGSGQFGVTVTATSGQELPFAQLAVFLLTSDEASYCGQNLPDWPTWRPFVRGQTVTYTVTGFQVFRLPCEVTGIRAIFNTRDDLHVGGFPSANQIIADSTLPVVYHLRQ